MYRGAGLGRSVGTTQNYFYKCVKKVEGVNPPPPPTPEQITIKHFFSVATFSGGGDGMEPLQKKFLVIPVFLLRGQCCLGVVMYCLQIMPSHITNSLFYEFEGTSKTAYYFVIKKTVFTDILIRNRTS